MSGVINKAKEVIPGAHPTHTTGTHTTGTHTGTTEGLAGHHNSRAANAADPRIDSDLDGSRNLGAAHNTTHTTGGGLTGTSHTGGGLTGHNTTGGGLTGTSHNTHTTGGGLTGTSHNTTTSGSGLTGHSNANPNTTGLTGAGHSTNTTAGPHKSDLLNKADPRIDSDLSKTGGHAHTIGAQDKHNNAGGTFGTHNTPSTHTGTTHNTHTAGSGLTGTTHNTTGTHNTHTTGGLTGSTGHSTNAGPHSSNLANKADPKVDSDLDGRATHGGVAGTVASHVKPGPAPNTAGPHKSDLLNKLDPRVDSNLDGSKTVGGNKTYAETYAHKDPHDASQVPPSVFAAHHGSPEILHGNHAHDRAGRHGSLSHQEQHRGI